MKHTITSILFAAAMLLLFWGTIIMWMSNAFNLPVCWLCLGKWYIMALTVAVVCGILMHAFDPTRPKR